MPLPIGATVRCWDGEAGKLKYVVFDPNDGEVTHLIVERGVLLHRDIGVPVSWVERTSEREIELKARIADLDTLPEYDEINFMEPDPDSQLPNGYRDEELRVWSSPYGSAISGKPWTVRSVRLGVRDDELVLRRGLPVLDRDRHTVGTIDHLVVEPGSGRVTHLVVRRSLLLKRQMHIVPVERVISVTEYGIRLDMTAEELDQQPLYKSPASDEQILANLEQALEADPRTRGAGLRVEVNEGVVRFIGDVTETVKDAAREIAQRIRGVIGFADDAFAPPAPPLRIGEPVYARDGRYGTLDKVVVDPYERRVTHLVVRKGLLRTEDRVIPIERVEKAELDGIYLDATEAELDKYPRYQEEVFVEPLPGWETVDPYAGSDTLFWGGPFIGVAPPVRPVIEHIVPLGIPADEVVVRRGADVFYNNELVGSLEYMLFDPASGTVTHLVVEEYDHGRRVIVPIAWVSELIDGAIVLNRWNPDQPGVPASEAARDDAEISADLSAHLHAVPALMSVQVEVRRGVARLYGVVATAADKEAAEAIARSTPGVLVVDNELEVRPES